MNRPPIWLFTVVMGGMSKYCQSTPADAHQAKGVQCCNQCDALSMFASLISAFSVAKYGCQHL